jgi:hypothetical protein
MATYQGRIWTLYNAARSATEDWDWALVIVVGAFVLTLSVRLTVAAPVRWVSNLFRPRPFTIYERAVADAAIKTPRDSRMLSMIDPKATEVKVTTFRFPSLKKGTDQKLDQEIWVSIPADLKNACSGAADPKQTLQQVLGLPMSSAPQMVYEITVKEPSRIFRPCASGPDPAVAVCGFQLPDPPAVKDEPADTLSPDASEAAYAVLGREYKPLRRDYDHLRFVANQMWNSYRTGFLRQNATALDYPYSGFPFTGMGWTYNWSPQSATHFGISEFVVLAHTQLDISDPMKPEDFCAPQH